MIELFLALPVLVQNAIAGIAYVPVTLLATAMMIAVFDNFIGPCPNPYIKTVGAISVATTYGGIMVAPIVIHGIVALPLIQTEGEKFLYAPVVAVWTVLSMSPIYLYSVSGRNKQGMLRQVFSTGMDGFLIGAIFATLILLVVMAAADADIVQARGMFFLIPLVGFWVLFIADLVISNMNWVIERDIGPERGTRYRVSVILTYAAVLLISFI